MTHQKPGAIAGRIQSMNQMHTLPRTSTNIVYRMAVSGIVFLLMIASSSHIHAAQCGGLPKGWLPANAEIPEERIVIPLGHESAPDVPRDPCKCTGTSCSPAAPTPGPDHRLGSVSSRDADLGPVRIPLLRMRQSEYPDTVVAGLRHEVVLGILRPPCGV